MAVPQSQLVALWQALGAKLAEMLSKRMHAEMVISVRDGQVQLVRINQSILPADLVPK